MDIGTELISINSESIRLADGNIYEQIYLDVTPDLDEAAAGCDPISTDQFDGTTDGSFGIICEREEGFLQEPMVYSLKEEEESSTILNSSATEDESMAVEALRQLGSSTVHNKASLLVCSNCDMQFQLTADFQEHASECKHSQLKCTICGKAFGCPTDFNNHLVGHAIDRPHSCRVCSTLFVSKKDLMDHMQTHEEANGNNNLQCKVCKLVFQRSSSLVNHMKIHTYQPGREIINALKMENSESTKDVAPLLGMNVNNLEDYELLHEEDFNDDVAHEMTIDDSFEDKHCVIAYEYVNESTEANEELICTEAKVVEITVKSANKPYMCKHCNKGFAREKALNSHYKMHSLLQTNYRCKNCDKLFQDEDSLMKHTQSCATVLDNHSLNLDVKQHVTLVENPRAKFYKHMCSNCGKRFSTKQKLHRHMWIHRKRVFSCEICANSFEKQRELGEHRLTMHQGNSPYVCNECGKSFSSRQGLWGHNRMHEDPSHPFSCTDCSKTFSSRQGYLIHKRAHTDERPYGCRFCWKSFRDGGTLRKHERIHTGERPHACPLCSRAFNQKVVLREHVRWLHTANKQPCENGEYNCDLCKQLFTDKDDLCAHIVKHSDQLAMMAKNASKSNVNGLANVGDANKGKRKLKVKGKLVLKVPLITKDEVEQEKPLLMCDLCGEKFLTSESLSVHIRVHI